MSIQQDINDLESNRRELLTHAHYNPILFKRFDGVNRIISNEHDFDEVLDELKCMLSSECEQVDTIMIEEPFATAARNAFKKPRPISKRLQDVLDDLECVEAEK